MVLITVTITINYLVVRVLYKQQCAKKTAVVDSKQRCRPKRRAQGQMRWCWLSGYLRSHRRSFQKPHWAPTLCQALWWAQQIPRGEKDSTEPLFSPGLYSSRDESCWTNVIEGRISLVAYLELRAHPQAAGRALDFKQNRARVETCQNNVAAEFRTGRAGIRTFERGLWLTCRVPRPCVTDQNAGNEGLLSRPAQGSLKTLLGRFFLTAPALPSFSS